MGVRRYEQTASRKIIEDALRAFGINCYTHDGVFWEQGHQSAMEYAVQREVDVVLTIDSDSLFTAGHIRILLNEFISYGADAICATQPRRDTHEVLCSTGDGGLKIGNKPKPVDSGHFGLTLLKVQKIAAMPKPWFLGTPNAEGSWKQGKTDPDIFFWKKWKAEGNTLLITPNVRLGHVMETAWWYDENMQLHNSTVAKWRGLNSGGGEVIDGGWTEQIIVDDRFPERPGPVKVDVTVYDGRLIDKARNDHTQFGEDGLIEAIFEIIGTTTKHCFEVGAADGEFYSNTLKLRDQGWSAILADADPELAAKSDEVECLKVDSIDNWLGDKVLYDLGIIDVDGQDYWLFHDMKLRPRVLVIEHSRYDCDAMSTSPPARHGTGQARASFLIDLAKEKKYKLVAKTFCNLVFVAEEAWKPAESFVESI